VRWERVDAVTLDAYGTLATLVDPVPALLERLRERGAERTPDQVRMAFEAEVAHYAPRAVLADDDEKLARLHTECAAVFSDAIGAELDAATYVGCLRFELLDGAAEAVERLRMRGLALAVVANWDASLERSLRKLGLRFDVVVPAAAKPDPAGLLRALDRLGVPPERALHVGDEPTDEQAARAAGMMFAWTPLSSVI
jgi:HAD superfamily hydrolase (TIGR01509 family)